MNTKIIALLMLVMLFATPVLATITVVINTPTSGQTFNNLPANVGPIDINFAITDDNVTVIDHNITIKVYDGRDWSTLATVTSDMNVRSTGTDENCTVSPTGGLAAYTCSVIWNMPGSVSMGEGPYYIDVNAVSVFPPADTHTDTNTLQGINVSNSLANSATIQALLLVISIVVFAGLIIAAVVSIGIIGTDPAKTAVALVGAGIVTAVLMSILGIIALMI